MGTVCCLKPHLLRHMQAVRDAEWRHFMNYNSFMACQELLTRGVGNDRAEATNKPVSATVGPTSDPFSQLSVYASYEW
jgi:hypothetical protein